MSELHMYHFYFFKFAPAHAPHAVLLFFASAAVAHGIIVLLKKSISYFVNIMYKHIFLNFGVILFINKEMVSLFQLHTYKFGLVYVAKTKALISCSCAVTAQLICGFVFAYAKIRFSDDAAHFLLNFLLKIHSKQLWYCWGGHTFSGQA